VDDRTETIFDYLVNGLEDVGLSFTRVADYRGAAAHIILALNPDLFSKPDAYKLAVEPTGTVFLPSLAAKPP
jgi:hypothetical protein